MTNEQLNKEAERLILSEYKDKEYQKFLYAWNSGLNKLGASPRDIFNTIFNSLAPRINLAEETVDKRHYCIKCKRKRKEDFMKIVNKKLHRTQWLCIDCNID